MNEYLPFLKSIACGNIVEIGTRCGVSTAAFLLGLAENENGGHLWSVDINPECAKLYSGNPYWSFVHGNSLDPDTVLPHIPDQFNVLLVDGDHAYAAAKFDLECYSQRVVSGGLILAHDVVPPEHVTPEMITEKWPSRGTRRAFLEFVAATGYACDILPGKWGMGVIRKS